MANVDELTRFERAAGARYAAALLSVGAALAAGLLVDGLLRSAPFVSLFFCAILFATWIGGLGPGLVATLLSIVAFGHFFLPAIGSFDSAVQALSRLAMFAAAALFMVSLTAAQRKLANTLRRTRSDLERAVRDLERLNNALRDENAERRRAEDNIRRAERELQLTVDTIPVMAAAYGPDGRIQFVNRTWREFTGLSLDTADPQRWGVAIHPDDLPAVETQWRAHLETGQPFQLEQRMRRADGEYRWHMISRVPCRGESGAVVRWYGAGYDIEDYKRALESLRRNETYLDEAQQLSRTGSIGWNISTGEIFWSKEAYKILGIDRAAVPSIGLVLARVHPDDRDLVRLQMERMRDGEPAFDFEHRLRMDDGSVRHVHVCARRVTYASGEEEVLGALMDATESKRAQAALNLAQAELAHANRVATLGEMSASIAHEVNQPLAAIVTNGEVLLRVLARPVPDIDDALGAVRQIVGDAHRAHGVVRRVRDLSKKADPDMIRLDLNAVVKDAVALVRREAFDANAQVVMLLARELPAVKGDRIQLQQVIINLAFNGLQAMSEVEGRERALTIRTRMHDAGQALVEIEDVGIGIEPENLERLFSAFFTTKPSGLGMGLSICRSIVEAHGGRVWASSNDGPGMTFRFTVPPHC